MRTPRLFVKHKVNTVLSLLFFVLSPYSFAESIINDKELDKARELFSGPTEEDFYKTDEMLISATGSLKPVFLAPSVASVITKEQIEAMGATTLDEVLETVPGLHVMPSILVGPLLMDYSIRGVLTSFNPQTLLMINGIPQRKLWTGGNDYRFILPIAAISRVEIVRGPGSAVHGADAFAGTINVITKDGQEVDGVQTGVRAGSFDSYDVWAQYGKMSNGWDVLASFESNIHGTDEDRVINSDLQTLLDLPPPNGFGTTASLAPATLNDDQKHYDFHFSIRKNYWTARVMGLSMWDTGNGVGAAPVLDRGDHKSDRYVAELLYENLNLHPDWELNVRTNYTYLNEENKFIIFPPGTVLPIGSDGNLNFSSPTAFPVFTDGYIGEPDEVNQTLGIEATSFYNGFSQHKFRFSVGYQIMKNELTERKNFGPGILDSTEIQDGTKTIVDGNLTDVSGTEFVYGPDKTRRLQFISVQDEWTLARTWELTAGVRYDEYSDFGSTINPRAALVWQTRYDLTTKLLYGRAFRAPTFAELYIQNNPVGNGNRNLDPEIIDTIELAADYRPITNLRLKANAFYYEIDGLIEYVLDEGGATSTTQNVRDQKAHGAEFEFNWQANEQLTITGNTAWHKAIDVETDKVVPNVPRAQAYGNIHYEFVPKLSVDAQGFWIGYRARAAGDAREKVDDYLLTNLTLRNKDVLKHVDLAFAIRNVLDEDIREPGDPVLVNDIPMNGRSYWAEIRARF